MSVTVTTGVDFGSAYTGLLGSAGYTVYTLNGTTFNTYQSRSTSVAHSGSLVASSFSGQIGTTYFVEWDTGGGSPAIQWHIVVGQVWQSGDSYPLNNALSGMILTGSIAASPAPGSSSFTVTLDAPVSVSTTSSDIVGLYVTFRSGAREPSFQRILACTISGSPPNTLALTTNAFASAPSANDLVVISG